VASETVSVAEYQECPSKASSNAPRSGMMLRTILSSNCYQSRNTFTYRLIPQHWTSITTAAHSKIHQARRSQRRARFHGQKTIKSCSRCGMKAVRGNTSLLPSLTAVKIPSGCAVRQNSISDLVQGPVVLELEEQPIASLALGILYRRRSNLQAAVMVTIQVMENPDFSSDNGDSSEAEQGRLSTSKQMVRPRRAALAGMEERGRVLGVDLRQVPRQAQYVHAGTWSGPEPNRLTPTDGQEAARHLHEPRN
jgi:hypothetical protein